MAEFAKRTRVPVDRTRLQIEDMMRRRGADQFFSGADKERAVLAFRLNGRHMRFTLPLGDTRSQQQIMARWRALWLVIKAKLEAIDVGIITIEEAFLAETILPDRRTVADVMLPQIESAYGTGKMPPLLPYYGDGGQA
jgi:hypothetical protein